MAKENLRISVYTQECGTEYEGRLLGVITPTEFYRLVNEKKWKSKTFTSEAVSLRAFASSFPKDEDVAGLRLVAAVKKRDGNDLPGKRLFVSEPLDFISKIGEVGKPEITMNTKGNTYIILERI